MKQKRKIILSGFLLILILGLGVYYLTMDNNAGPDNAADWICTAGINGITVISIHSIEDNQLLSFIKEETAWEGDDGSSYDNEQFAPYLAALGYMKTEEKLEATDSNKQEYGLKAPAYTVSVSYDDGKKFNYNIGKFVDNLGLYISSNSGNSVYLIDVRRARIMEDMVASLYDVALTNVKFNEIRGIQLSVPESDLILINRSEAPRANGGFYWNIFKPFAWNADTKKVDVLIETMKDIGTLKRTKDGTSAEECGLEKDESQLPAVTFYDTYDSELTVYLGNVHGDYIYCKTNYLKGIYLIDKKIQQVINISVDDIMDTALYYYEIPSVKTCTVQWLGETHELSTKWVAANEEGKRGQRCYLDGNSITGAKYSSIVDWFSDTKVKQILNSPNEQGEILGNITVERLSPPYEQILTFRTIPTNDSIIQVNLDQSAAVYLEKQDADSFISSLRQ
ncbi:DUF4340 domain-containing protein [Muricomes intestini]|jgi:hypothetical protein|uniref:DUF4340 domain-containing protein n=1 Tax=Muricomes intestini TaxID=1796634 RepID=UPI002FE34E30